jgi:hypothetical protein
VKGFQNKEKENKSYSNRKDTLWFIDFSPLQFNYQFYKLSPSHAMDIDMQSILANNINWVFFYCFAKANPSLPELCFSFKCSQ